MNDGVKILLERMQTNPEEFHGDYNRWNDLISKFEKFFNASERALINGALTNIRREEFTSVVMQELLKEKTSPLRELLNLKLSNTQAAGLKAQADEIRAKHPFQPFLGEIE